MSKLDAYPWCRSVGRTAQKWPRAWIVCLIVAVLFFILSCSAENPGYDLVLAVGFLLLGCIWYERRVYYQVITELEQEIEGLKGTGESES